jgi:4-hydroxy-tetrahydrodipicolinate reductase
MSARRVLVVGALGRMGRAVRAALEQEPALVLAAALEAKDHPEQGAQLEHGVVVSDDSPRRLRSATSRSTSRRRRSRSRPRARAPTRASPTSPARRDFARGGGRARRARCADPDRARGQLLARGEHARLAGARGRTAAGSAFDAEIVELHHAGKRDAPSGTALRLADAIAEGRDDAARDALVLERAARSASGG